jgi:predicted DNA-binding transcriptional regulator YafY
MSTGMAFEKSLDLIRLAEMAASRHNGVSLVDVVEEFGVNPRTAQRMIRGLEMAFPSVVWSTDRERRRWWKLSDTTLLRMQGIRDSELAALDMSIRRAQRDGAIGDVKALMSLRDRLLAAMPSPHARRAEVDAEAVLEAQGYACRPGPKVQVGPRIMGTIAVAIKAPFSLVLTYRGAQDDEARERTVEPYGLLRGIRQYLIARDLGNGHDFRRFRLDRIEHATITGHSFARDPAFDLETYAAQSFGSWHSDAERVHVVWRFAPSAAPVAREFEFHPTQKLIDEPDGSLRVEFTASGWIEMIWHLYQWGDQVEVVAPEQLRAMVEGFQRGDLGVLP